MNIVEYVNQSLYGDLNTGRITRSIICLSFLECHRSINPDIIINIENRNINEVYSLLLKEDTFRIIEKSCEKNFSELFCLLCRHEQILKKFNENPKSAKIMIYSSEEIKDIYLHYNEHL